MFYKQTLTPSAVVTHINMLLLHVITVQQ